MTAPVAKRADQLVVGDRIQPGYLPAYARSGEGLVMLVDPYAYRGADWVFVAFACADGDRNCAHYLPDGEVKVVPADDGFGYSRADDEITQPIAGREPLHTGAMTDAGLVDETVPRCPNCRHDIAQHDADGCCLKCHCHPGCTAEPACGATANAEVTSPRYCPDRWHDTEVGDQPAACPACGEAD